MFKQPIFILLVLETILNTSCIPTNVNSPRDARETEINQTIWSLYSKDSAYFDKATVGYQYRKIQDSCFESLLFNKSHSLEKHDSCKNGITEIVLGSWIWPISDSLQLQFAGSSPSLRSFRYTGDTLQLFIDNPVKWDSVNGVRIYPVYTFIKV